MRTRPPVLLELGLLALGGQSAAGQGQGLDSGVLRALAELNRADRPLVLVAERPDRWTPTRNRVDRALEGQSRIEREFHRGGGVLDAVIYLDLGLFSRRRKRRDVLADLADRYGSDLDGLVAVVGTSRIAEAVGDSVGRVVTVDSVEELRKALVELA